jgi:glycosyltransferase involved in cell wall biosynthesis
VTKRIRVLFFISSLEGGGAERVMVEILRNINRNYIEPILILLYPYDHSPYKGLLPKDLEVIVIKRESDTSLEKIKQFKDFLKCIKNKKPDLILSMLTHCNIMAIVAGLMYKIRTIVSEHNTLSEIIKTEDGRKMMGISGSFLVRKLYRFANKIIAVSEGIKDDLIKNFGISKEKISVIYNPVDLENIRTLSKEPVDHHFFESNVPIIISVGRLIYQKGFDLFIRALKKLSSQIDFRAIILGNGPEKESLEDLAFKLDIIDKISFAGFKANPFAFLSKSDIFVLSSRFEGLPMAILEAMACEVPIIATDCKSGPREILQDGEYGIFVPIEDEDALSVAMLKLLKDSALRERFKLLSKERVTNFSIDKIVKKYEELILNTVL